MKCSIWYCCTVLAVALMAGASGCDLPQDDALIGGGEGGSNVAAGDGAYTIVQILDGSGDTTTGFPGADLDALVATRSGAFLFAGCADVSLVGEDSVTHRGNLFLDPDLATLHAAEQVSTHGFVSLAGGTLFCELPLPLVAGDLLEIWEMEADGADPLSVGFASVAGGDVVWADASVGSQQIVVP
jgi:hypothetical protein